MPNYETDTISKMKQALLDVISLMQQSPRDMLSQQCIKEIQMRFQALVVDLKKSKVQIPYIALEPNNGQCLNNFNEKQLKIVETQVQKYRNMAINFNIANDEIIARDRNKIQN